MVLWLCFYRLSAWLLSFTIPFFPKDPYSFIHSLLQVLSWLPKLTLKRTDLRQSRWSVITERNKWLANESRVLLSAPRRSPAVPNADGTLALYTLSTYSFESHKRTSEIRLLDLANGQSTLITNDEDASEPNWLGHGNQIIWLKKEENGHTKLIQGSADNAGQNQIVADVPGSISGIKLKVLEDGKTAIAVVGMARPDGRLYNAEDKPKKYSSGLVYDSVMVRHWDKYVTPNRNAIWYGLLQKSTSRGSPGKGKYMLSNLTNAFNGTRLESPIPPFGGIDHFDISSTGIVFIAKDPKRSPSTSTNSNFYFLPILNFEEPSLSSPQKVEVDGLEGASASPVLSPDGKAALFLQMKEDGYESDKNRIIFVPDVYDLSTASEVLKSEDGKGLWDRSPSAVSWSVDAHGMFLQAEENGKNILFVLDVPNETTKPSDLPKALTRTGSVTDVRPLAADSSLLFLSSSNFVDNSVYTVLDPSDPAESREISSNSHNGISFGLSKDQISDIWFNGSGDYKVHAWVIKPSNFSEGTKYPLAYLIHGGPQGAWLDQWSTRWNPAIFAEQGYVVVAPNPTGSTGYGQAFCDAIQRSWGGLPYEDLVQGFDYIKDNLAYVDTARAVALGASYGGYMMNWIQGHPLGREFKALVCHDGVFSMANQMSSDEQWFPNHDLGGPFWTAMDDWEKWNPARFTKEWATPQLVIHNELDYRLPISEGLAAFNVLQQRGVESRFLTFPDENHWVLKEENSLVWHTVVLNWINRFANLLPYKDEKDQGFEVQNPPPHSSSSSSSGMKLMKTTTDTMAGPKLPEMEELSMR